jgi:CheY-like chemotaxis protein
LATLSRGLATKHQVDFVLVQEKETIPQVTADQVAVRQAILSLLSVAIPRASGGRVELTCRSQRWEVLVGVHCAAYPDGPKPALADETESLRIAQELAELGGGRLELDVDARAFHASLALPALEQLPVVVIDDNVDTLRLLERYTAGTRYRLIPASDQQQAVELAKRTRPQVIVLDVMMPDVDGWEVLGQLRQDPATTSIPVVICTILAQKELAEHLGADAFIRKPVTRQPFLEALDSLLAREQGQPPERESN